MLSQLSYQFTSVHLYIMQLSSAMQDLYVNMPYLDWEMVPHGPNHTLLTIAGGMVAISVEIKVLRSQAPYTFLLLVEWNVVAYKLMVLSFTLIEYMEPTYIELSLH